MTRREQSLGVVAISLLIGISHGIAYGVEGGNQLVYLPPGLRLVDPGFLARDWWASETTVYHVAISYLIAVLEWAHLLPWAAAAANIVLAAATYWYAFRLIRRLSDDNAFIVWIIFIFLFVGIARSQSVAATYLFDAELQASSIASFATVLALYLFVSGRMLVSGLALAVAGLFHANFLILGILCFGLAHLFLGWRSLIRRSLLQLGPSLIVLAAHVPLILTVSGHDLAPDMRAEAQRLIIEVAAPHHYQPRLFLTHFIPLIGWNVIALAALMFLARGQKKYRHFLAIYASFLIVITIGTLLTTVVFIDFVSRLFVWRIAPFALFCAHMIIAIAAGHVLFDRGLGVTGRVVGPTLWAGGIGIAVIVVYLAVQRSVFDPRVWVGMIGLIGLISAWWWGRTDPIDSAGRRHRMMIGLVLLVGLVILRVPNIIAISDSGISVTRNFNLVGTAAMDRARIDLYRWARTTAPDSRFLVPPMLSGFRLHAGRAVYVDWKGRPFRPDELIEWHRRIVSITGLERWRHLEELDAAYDTLHDVQIRAIVDTNNIRYVVLDKAAKNGRSLGDVVFENDEFLVIRIAAGVAVNVRLGQGETGVFALRPAG